MQNAPPLSRRAARAEESKGSAPITPLLSRRATRAEESEGIALRLRHAAPLAPKRARQSHRLRRAVHDEESEENKESESPALPTPRKARQLR